MKLKQVLKTLAETEVKEGVVAERGAGLGERTTVSVREAKDRLSSLLQRAAAGEEVVIASDGEPKAMLVRFRPRMGGKPWRPLAEFRKQLPLSPDSTGAIRRQRDEGY